MAAATPERLKIGVSACFFYPDPARAAFALKTLQYVEQSVPHWIMSGGALPVMIPSPTGETARGDVGFDDYAQWLDGLVLHGGADVWPGSYGETPMQERWNGDRNRDAYEIALVQAFAKAGKPVFGICRGLQLINVAFGGTLYQDIPTQRPEALVHRDAVAYDRNFHQLALEPGTRLATLLAGQPSRTINSVHHQGVKDLAANFVVEARCPDDGMIEAIRHTGGAWVAGVQWHPEFHKPEHGTLDDAPILQDFLNAARAARTPA
ncbi:MAG: type 1 glutamine amidotransferase [Rhodoferax sp.]|nr:type 1 glutamine amidotransferase [Rhodoferax sp.]